MLLVNIETAISAASQGSLFLRYANEFCLLIIVLFMRLHERFGRLADRPSKVETPLFSN